MELRGKRAIVTGGYGGIGGAVADAFAGAGAAVISLDVREPSGKPVATSAQGTLPQYRRCDVADPDEVARVFAGSVEQLGGLDVLVHTAGIEPGCDAATVNAEQLNRVVAVNFNGTVYTNQAAFRAMQPQGDGVIVNFASGVGISGMAGSADYAASKAAVLGWTRSVAREWGPFGVRVNAITPLMRTPLYESHRARLSPELQAAERAALQARIVLGGDLGDPETDLAPVLVFLASDGARFITGQTIAIDGGASMR